jgi:hypothetical protein
MFHRPCYRFTCIYVRRSVLHCISRVRAACFTESHALTRSKEITLKKRKYNKQFHLDKEGENTDVSCQVSD